MAQLRKSDSSRRSPAAEPAAGLSFCLQGLRRSWPPCRLRAARQARRTVAHGRPLTVATALNQESFGDVNVSSLREPVESARACAVS